MSPQKFRFLFFQNFCIVFAKYWVHALESQKVDFTGRNNSCVYCAFFILFLSSYSTHKQTGRTKIPTLTARYFVKIKATRIAAKQRHTRAIELLNFNHAR